MKFLIALGLSLGFSTYALAQDLPANGTTSDGGAASAAAVGGCYMAYIGSNGSFCWNGPWNNTYNTIVSNSIACHFDIKNLPKDCNYGYYKRNPPSGDCYINGRQARSQNIVVQPEGYSHLYCTL